MNHECVTSIDPRALYRRTCEWPAMAIIDVSTVAEFERGHVHGAQNLPMDSDELEAWMRKRESGSTFEGCCVMCAGGVRSVKVCDAYPDAQLTNVEGGLRAWESSRLPIVRDQSKLPLQSQVQLVGGCMILGSLLLALSVHPFFAAVTAFVGVGQVYAGLTRSCPMNGLLTKMPWNRSQPTGLTGPTEMAG